jgi:hypothetical protein
MAKDNKSLYSWDKIIYGLVSEVGCGTMSAKEASDKLREYVQGMDEKERAEFREKALGRASTIMQVAELFKQELTLIGAGQ